MICLDNQFSRKKILHQALDTFTIFRSKNSHDTVPLVKQCCVPGIPAIIFSAKDFGTD